MERIFYSKKTSIMFVVAMLVLLILLCMLLTALTQMASMKHRAEYLAELIESAKKRRAGKAGFDRIHENGRLRHKMGGAKQQNKER